MDQGAGPYRQVQSHRRRRRMRPGRTGQRVLAVAVALLLVAGVGGVAWTSGLIGHHDKGSGGSAAAKPDPTLPPPPRPRPALAADLAGGTAPTAAGLAAALRAPLADERLGGRVSAQVVDVATGTVLLDRNSTHLATPASTTKITTAAAVLAVLPADHRIMTRVVAGAQPGEIVLVGGGDPTISAAAPGQPTSYEGAARFADLASAVKRSGTSVTKVVVDTSLYTGPAEHPTWDPTDVDGGYITPIRALMADGGRTDPSMKSKAHEKWGPRTHTPELDAGRAFARYLGLPPTAVVEGKAQQGATALAEVGSAPLVRLVEQMLLASDNVLAEGLVRQVAIARQVPASFQGAADAVRAVLKDLGVDTSTEKLLDGSGLSPQDQLSPALLTSVLRVASTPDHQALHALFAGLPVGGYDGTLDDRFVSSQAAAAAGVVRAKTGTLTGVSTLSGVVEDASGRLLVFAFMADQVPAGGTDSAEAALDRLAAALAGCGCA